MRRIAIVIAVAAAAQVLAADPERCFQAPGRHYGAGVAHHLARAGVPHRVAAEAVCVEPTRWSDLEAAMRDVDRFYWKVSRPLADACEEDALTEWAVREKLRFDISTAYDLKRRPAGRTLYLRSYTQEEMESNRRRLRDAPRDAECKATTVALRP